VRVIDRDLDREQQPAYALTLKSDEEGGHDRVLSIAVDPDFARTHFVFLLQTGPSASGAACRLARYREVRGTLGERAILLETVSTTDAQAAAVLRFGRDGKLFLALDDRAGRGRLLRLNADGTMRVVVDWSHNDLDTGHIFAVAIVEMLVQAQKLGADPTAILNQVLQMTGVTTRPSGG